METTSEQDNSSVVIQNHATLNQTKDGCHNRTETLSHNSFQASKCKRYESSSIRAFVGFAGIVMCAQSTLAIYSKSVLTSIEKRFEISSSLAGFIVGSFNIGNLLFVVLVSKLSSKGHRPRIMAIGSLLIALGGFVNYTPHLATQPYQPSDDNITRLSDCDTTSTLDDSNTTPNINPNLYLVLVLGEILQGIGATVHIPLSSSYVDDFASEENSPVYLGISFVLQNIGPGFGYLIGSWTSTFYVDFDRVPAENVSITIEDKEVWVGAWWLGYLIISAWVIVAAIPLFCFPKSMRKEKSKKKSRKIETEKETLPETDKLIYDTPHVATNTQCPDQDIINMASLSLNKDEEGSNIISTFERSEEKELGFCADFWLTLKKLVTNPIYLWIIFAYSGLMFVVGALTAFMPKFIEVVYHLSPRSANLAFGLAVPPTMCIGLLGGGIVVKKFMWNRRGILRFVMISGVISLIPIFCAFFITCGHTHQDCFNHSASMNESSPLPSAKIPCATTDCYTVAILFVIVMSMGALIAAVMVTPIFTVVLRSVDPEDKCTAIGVMFLVMRVLGLVPAPVVTGAVIDQTCIKWNRDCGSSTNCIKYNVDQFRVRYLSLLFMGIVVSLLFTALTYFFVRRRDHQSKPATVSKLITLCLRRYIKTSREDSVEEETANA